MIVSVDLYYNKEISKRIYVCPDVSCSLLQKKNTLKNKPGKSNKSNEFVYSKLFKSEYLNLNIRAIFSIFYNIIDINKL